jgi:hypothetical protein
MHDEYCLDNSELSLILTFLCLIDNFDKADRFVPYLNNKICIWNRSKDFLFTRTQEPD